MTSFGWKRKSGENICVSKSKAFETEAKDEDDVPEINSGEIDWLTLHPKRKCIQLEDTLTKSKRLQNEATVLASSERYWEALQKFDEAQQLTPDDEKIYEMKSQAYLCVGELFPAVSSATKAVTLKSTWWLAHQTLGRALLQIGEVTMALKSFERAIHVHPCEEELWQDDLKWTQSLLLKKQNMQHELEKSGAESGVKITEVCSDSESPPATEDHVKGKKGELGTELLRMSSMRHGNKKAATNLRAIPESYVYMRN